MAKKKKANHDNSFQNTKFTVIITAMGWEWKIILVEFTLKTPWIKSQKDLKDFLENKLTFYSSVIGFGTMDIVLYYSVRN